MRWVRSRPALRVGRVYSLKDSAHSDEFRPFLNSPFTAFHNLVSEFRPHLERHIYIEGVAWVHNLTFRQVDKAHAHIFALGAE